MSFEYRVRAVLRWVGFIVGCLLEACSGTLYAWSSYSESLGEKLGYGKTELAVIVGIGDNGLYLSGVLAGLLISKVGPRWTSLVGGCLMLGGYFLMAYTYDGKLPNSNYILMGFYFCLAGVGSSCSYIGGLTTNVNNFSASTRGVVVGALVSLYGLSALIFTQFNAALFVDTIDITPEPVPYPPDFPTVTPTPEPIPTAVVDTFSYLLFLGYVPAAICLLGAVSLWIVGPEPEQSKVLQPVREVSEKAADSETDALITSQHSRASHESEIEVNFSTKRLFKTRDFWLMFVGLMFTSGAGLMYINSVGSIVKALATEGDNVKAAQDFQVSLISAFSCIGRLGIGLLSDLLLRFFGIRRRVLFSWCIFLMLLGQILMLFVGDLKALSLATVIIGFAYGGIFSITPTLVSERFGVSNFGINWGWMCWATAIGGQIMTLMFGVFYDKQANEDEYCPNGPSCYSGAYYLNTVTCGFALLVAIFFSMRRRNEDVALAQAQKAQTTASYH